VPWARIALRVAGSWIAASGPFMWGWSLPGMRVHRAGPIEKGRYSVRRFIRNRFLCAAAALVLLVGCNKKNDTVSQAEKADKASGIRAPGSKEVKKIAEDGFVYGLPIVMNYAVQHDFAIDKNSGQFKAPFNEIWNDHQVFTYKDTSVPTPNSDTPYSMSWL